MKFKWPWQRRAAPKTTPRPAEPGDSAPPTERGWHGSSSDLHDGLKVVEDADVTIPGELGPAERRRQQRNGS